MSLIQKIGYIRRDLNILHSWCKCQSGMGQMHNSRYAFNRTHKWFKHSVILSPNPTITQGYWDERVFRLGNRIYPEWDCALLCHYGLGGHMKPHTDHVVFHFFTVLVNIGYCTFRIGNEEHLLDDGQVISFNSNIPHELLPVSSERASLTFRRIHSIYIPN
ncbi:cupin domain-containing protein [Hassallia byssoidea VB512170]|uniref:Cupin domain-containing protein n=1 Tax=Hassallia byssoidea VB512170 TaxID=1304833 RepID=A0A846HIM6_9CYAN|nr:cupin domain-containing protein [Hassalia byssoidea]NEU77195.1 cupin domain-containing protein [Hassalia byssoidea VB512170]